ncbi:hypothetical protein Agub_g9217, partial [Astrephomene gubernaculifera]
MTLNIHRSFTHGQRQPFLAGVLPRGKPILQTHILPDSGEKVNSRLMGRQGCHQRLKQHPNAFRSVAQGLSDPLPLTPRLYSNLNPRTLGHEPGSLWGATLLVAGTTVGAGILALPAVTQDSGFAATSGALAGCAAFAAVTGLLLAEVHIHVATRYGCANVTLPTLAAKTLGPGGASAATLLYAFHSFALLVAYVARAGQMVADAAHLPSLAGAAAFALTFGGMCFVTTPRQFDAVNGALLGLAAAAFVGLLSVSGPHVDWPALSAANWSAVPPTLPVLALAFVFHNMVPLVVHNLECDVRKVRTSIILGVLIPAGMYLVWDGAILGSLNNLAVNAAQLSAAPTAASAASSPVDSASTA